MTEESPAEDYHKLRKRGRRLRYALEFLRDVYGGAAEELVRPLKKLQDVLGDHQDAKVTTPFLRELAAAKGWSRKLPPQAVFVVGSISHRYEVQARELRARFPKAYRKVKSERWNKLKKAMGKARPQEEEN
jgi:CHAD domain-containing protein